MIDIACTNQNELIGAWLCTYVEYGIRMFYSKQSRNTRNSMSQIFMTLQGVPFSHMFLSFPDYLTFYETQKLIAWCACRKPIFIWHKIKFIAWCFQNLGKVNIWSEGAEEAGKDASILLLNSKFFVRPLKIAFFELLRLLVIYIELLSKVSLILKYDSWISSTLQVSIVMASCHH